MNRKEAQEKCCEIIAKIESQYQNYCEISYSDLTYAVTGKLVCGKVMHYIIVAIESGKAVHSVYDISEDKNGVQLSCTPII